MVARAGRTRPVLLHFIFHLLRDLTSLPHQTDTLPRTPTMSAAPQPHPPVAAAEGAAQPTPLPAPAAPRPYEVAVAAAELRPVDCNLAALCGHVQAEGFGAGAFSDVVVEAMGATYHLHRLILSRSTYFR
jgi:hypothetical protein